MKKCIRYFSRQHCLLICIVSIMATPLRSEVTLDGSIGSAQNLSGPDYQITENLGQRTGGNLFHSFGRFNLGKTESATFSGSPDIHNVISRVTGGQTSTIDGLLKSTIPNANLYFINPAGVFFGENARIDVQGSFHTSTADYLRFKDGVRFNSSDVTTHPILTTAIPEAFGFLGGNTPGKIAVLGGADSLLEVTPGKTLSLIGGDINIKNSALFAPGGQINLASVQSAGEVIVNESGLDTTLFTEMGDIKISSNQNIVKNELDVSADTAGKIFIHGGQMVMNNANVVAGTANGNGGDIDIALTGNLNINGATKQPGEDSTPIRGLSTITSGAGKAGNIEINVLGLQLHDNASIISTTGGHGNAGDLVIKAVDIDVFNNGIIFDSTLSSGHGGNVMITATRQLHVHNGGQIVVSTLNSGNSGNLDVKAEQLTMREGRIASFPLKAETILKARTIGKAGNIVLDVQNIEINKSDILSTAFNVDNTNDALLLDGIDRVDSGNITFKNANSIKLSNGGKISTDTLKSGNGGAITIGTNSLELDNGFISAKTEGTGKAGKIIITADNIQLDASKIDSESTLELTNQPNNTDGMSGNIEITANKRLQLRDASKISVSTEQAQAGDIQIDGKGVLLLSRNSKIETSVADGEGAGGSITINSPVLALDTSSILANAVRGDGGNITITGLVFESPGSLIDASSQVEMDGLVSLKPDTTISGSLSVLSSAFLDVSNQLGERCSARTASGNSFITKGSGNIAPAPGNLTPSNLLDFTTDQQIPPQGSNSSEQLHSTQSAKRKNAASESDNEFQLALKKTGCGKNNIHL